MWHRGRRRGWRSWRGRGLYISRFVSERIFHSYTPAWFNFMSNKKRERGAAGGWPRLISFGRAVLLRQFAFIAADARTAPHRATAAAAVAFTAHSTCLLFFNSSYHHISISNKRFNTDKLLYCTTICRKLYFYYTARRTQNHLVELSFNSRMY